ncbi:MAG: NUDIX domain-containing protein [Ilumatobacteraceae bacterium]
MGFPHPTIDVPGHHPGLAAELSGLHADPDALGAALVAACHGAEATPGHVCATAWVFSTDRSEMLLVRHRRLGWATPGGHVHIGESTRAGALRELHEETALTAGDVRPLLPDPGPAIVHVTDVAAPGEPAHRHWNVGWCFTADSSLGLSAGHGARWFAVDDLPDDAPDDLRPVTAVLLTLNPSEG